MKKSNWIGIGLVIAAIATHNLDMVKLTSLIPSISGASTPDVVTEPTPGMKTIVASIKGKVTDGGDASKLSAFYVALADVVNRDSNVLKSMVQFQRAHKASLSAAFIGTNLVGKYNVSGPINDAIAMALIGKVKFEPIALDDTKRKRLVEVLLAVSWALGE